MQQAAAAVSAYLLAQLPCCTLCQVFVPAGVKCACWQAVHEGVGALRVLTYQRHLYSSTGAVQQQYGQRQCRPYNRHFHKLWVLAETLPKRGFIVLAQQTSNQTPDSHSDATAAHLNLDDWATGLMPPSCHCT